MVHAAEVDSLGRFLFTTFAGDVRIWNIGRWASFGRLGGAAHSPKYVCPPGERLGSVFRSEVSCLSVTNNEDGIPFVFTGSRDHYVKMYEVNPRGQLHTRVNGISQFQERVSTRRPSSSALPTTTTSLAPWPSGASCIRRARTWSVAAPGGDTSSFRTS